MNIVCPYCGGDIETILEYRPGSYSEHRDHTGFECDNWECGAEWDKYGRVREYPKSGLWNPLT